MSRQLRGETDGSGHLVKALSRGVVFALSGGVSLFARRTRGRR
jgi:hypothetical protein